VTLKQFDRFSVVFVELMFWIPLFAVPIIANMVTGGEEQLVRDLTVSGYLTLVFAVVTSYRASYRYIIPMRLAAFVVLGLGSMFITGVALLTHSGGDRLLMRSIMDTNPAEMQAMADTYGSIFHPSYLFIIIPPLIALTIQARSRLFWSPPKYSLLVLFVLFIGQLAARHEPGSWGVQSTVRKLASIFPYIYPLEAYPPLQPYVMLGDTYWARQQFSALVKNDFPVADVTAPPAMQPRTYVVVVGESLSKYHMHLYGYNRPTTPNLEKRGLYVFRDMVTSHAQTVEALFAALTLKTADGNLRTIIDVFNSAGFRTYWLSNQWQFSLHSFPSNMSMISEIVSNAKEHVWLNSVDLNGKENLSGQRQDEQLLPPLRDALADQKHRDKLIFVHLVGSHFNYASRYKRFTDFGDNVTCPTGTPARKIDEYDNSVIYNDSIVSQIIDAVKEVSGESFVLYFSDHGEEVFDFRNHAGHLDSLLSPYMAEVPFMLWLSPQYREHHAEFVANLANYVRRPASTATLSYALADLAQLSFPSDHRERSVFSDKFVPGPRITADRNYDDFKTTWRPDAVHAAGYELISCTNKNLPNIQSAGLYGSDTPQ
jgi:glucan phosphoethanolaminetransferase (alkaline phosphatase superfamily)